MNLIRIFLIFCLLFPVAATEAQEAEQAKILWEQAIAAKGGREQLHQVTNLVVSYRETVRNFLDFAVHRGDVERLYVFPNKSWSWVPTAPGVNPSWTIMARPPRSYTNRLGVFTQRRQVSQCRRVLLCVFA